MATFRIGQRVRVVDGERSLVGREATIAGIGNGSIGGNYLNGELARCDYWVSVDGDWWPKPRAARADQIEPVQYDGNQVVSWDECAWQPEGEIA